ncbi:MAG: sodium-dependent bicarbonate transport family permease [Acidimicrobiia bacterium]
MDISLLRNLTDPAILFFFAGLLIGLVKSNLEVPAPITKFLSLYLLMAVGFRGGHELARVGLSSTAVKTIGAAVILAIVLPALGFFVLRRRISAFDAAAIAATYGSVSAVTFATASQFLTARDNEAGGYLTVALVLMESPAIVMAVLLATWARSRAKTMVLPENERAASLVSATVGVPVHDAKTQTEMSETIPEKNQPAGGHPSGPLSIKEVLREAFTDGAHLVLISSMVIGALSGNAGWNAMDPFINGLWKGMLAFFLLEMGLLVARQLREVRDVGPFLIAYAVIMPLVGATLALGLGQLFGLNVGDQTLLMVLAASASYIVAPAVIRYAIPEARPSRYFTMALAITFPLNIALGIPLYYAVANAVAG